MNAADNIARTVTRQASAADSALRSAETELGEAIADLDRARSVDTLLRQLNEGVLSTHDLQALDAATNAIMEAADESVPPRSRPQVFTTSAPPQSDTSTAETARVLLYQREQREERARTIEAAIAQADASRSSASRSATHSSQPPAASYAQASSSSRSEVRSAYKVGLSNFPTVPLGKQVRTDLLNFETFLDNEDPIASQLLVSKVTPQSEVDHMTVVVDGVTIPIRECRHYPTTRAAILNHSIGDAYVSMQRDLDDVQALCWLKTRPYSRM